MVENKTKKTKDVKQNYSKESFPKGTSWLMNIDDSIITAAIVSKQQYYSCRLSKS